MLHNAYMYIAIVREIIRFFFKHAKSSSQMLNSFDKKINRNVIFL